MASPPRQQTADEILQSGDVYFALQAYVGTTKHMGGLESTRELIELCHITADSYVLDVGCGVGATPVYLARQVGCRVVGVDVREAMVALAQERARRSGVSDRVELRLADARDLPFTDGLFDAVVVESVTAFIPDKARAVQEYARVAKSGGYVGLNEETWLEPSPPAEVNDFVVRTWDGVTPQMEAGWKGLLTDAGLQIVSAKTYRLKAGKESSQVQRYSLGDMLRMLWRSIRLFRSPAFRKYQAESMKMPKGLWDYLGYGIYVGRKG